MEQLCTNARLRIRKNEVIHIKRHLPNGQGKIQTFVGQEVTPGDVIGQGASAVGFRVVHLAKDLKLNPKKALSCLKRKMGQTIYQGELLAYNPGFLGIGRKIILSPVDGILEAYNEKKGDLQLKLLPKEIKLASGVYGIVDKVDNTIGVITIKTMASIIHGIFGSGKEREGLLRVLGGPEMLTSSRQINEHMRGDIIVGGQLMFLDALEKSVNEGVSGVVIGGVNADDYKAMVGGEWNLFYKRWSDVGISLLVTEGFGSIPIGEDIFNLLKEHDRKSAILDGNRGRLILPTTDQNSMIYIRKTKLPISFDIDSEPQVDLIAMKEGQSVRIVADPYLGYQGVIMAIDKTITELPSGIKTYLVTVATKRQKVRVPYLNLEIIGC